MSNIPSLPIGSIADNNGMITPQWSIFFNQLITELQNNISNQGLVTPNQPVSIINQLTTLPNSLNNGTLIYDSTNHLAKVMINGALKTITTT